MAKRKYSKQDVISAYADALKVYPPEDITRDWFCTQYGIPKMQIRTLFGSFTGLKRSYNSSGSKEEKQKFKFEEDKTGEADNLNREKAFYNPSTKQYLIYCPSIHGNLVLSRKKVEALFEAYSNFDGNPATLNEICRAFELPRKVFYDIKTSMGWTHDSLPITPEQAEESSTDDLASDLYQKKMFNVEQKYKKLLWKEIESQAQKWRDFKNGEIKPFQEILDSWEPPTVQTGTDTKISYKPGKALVINLSDLHFGKFAEGDYIMSGNDWGIDDTLKMMENYLDRIKERYCEFKDDLFGSNVYVNCLGDFIHSMTEFTTKGTKIESSPVGEKQLEIACDSLHLFFQGLLDFFKHKNIIVNAVSGNHDHIGDWVLLKLIEKWFSGTTNRIQFNVSSKRYTHYSIGDSFFMLEHGSSAYFKSMVPKSGVGRDSYVRKAFMNVKDMYAYDNRYFITADQHHKEFEESDYEFIMVSSPNPQDRYEDNQLYKNRPRQTLFVVDPMEGIVNHINVFL